jgi:hypothetical protein
MHIIKERLIAAWSLILTTRQRLRPRTTCCLTFSKVGTRSAGQEISHFMEHEKFITVFTRARHRAVLGAT